MEQKEIIEGYSEGEKCNRDECVGVIEKKDIDGCCSCHSNPPCSYCTTPKEYCPICGWDANDEQTVSEKQMHYTAPIKQDVPKEIEDDGKKYDVHRYFDDVYEATHGRNLTIGDATRLRNKLNNAKPRHYVYYGIKDTGKKY